MVVLTIHLIVECLNSATGGILKCLGSRGERYTTGWGMSGRGSDISQDAQHCGINTNSSVEYRKAGQYNREKNMGEAWTGTQHDYIFDLPIPEQTKKVYFLESDME